MFSKRSWKMYAQTIKPPDVARRLTHLQVIRDTVAYTEHGKRYVSLFPITFGTTAHICILDDQENCDLTRRGLRPQAFWTYTLRLRRLIMKEYCILTFLDASS